MMPGTTVKFLGRGFSKGGGSVTPASSVVLGQGPRLTGPLRLGGSTRVLRVFHCDPNGT